MFPNLLNKLIQMLWNFFEWIVEMSRIILLNDICIEEYVNHATIV